MSANHTSMPAETYLALEQEIIELQRGSSPQMRRAEEEIRREAARLEEQSRRNIERMSEQRRRNVKKISEASRRALDAMTGSADSADAVSRAARELDSAIHQSSADLSAINTEMRTAYASATELYAEASRQIAQMQTDPDYMKFAPDRTASLVGTMQSLSAREMSPEAMQMFSANLMNDVLLTDIVVARLRASYEMQHIELQRMARQLIDCIESARENIRAIIDDAESEKIDLDYWSKGRTADMEREAREIMQRAADGRYRTDYTAQMLADDFARVKAMMEGKNLVIGEAYSAYAHSDNRMAQAEQCIDILAEKHHFRVVGQGFDGGDKHQAYIVRMRRDVDGAELEIIVNNGATPGTYEVYFRIDATTYVDELLMDSINNSIIEDFNRNGVVTRQFRRCRPERLETFNPANITISEQTRALHGIQRR